MRQGIQSNFKHEELKVYGCYFFTLCAWVNIAFGKEFTDDYIIQKFEEYKKKKMIGKNCWISEPVLIFNDLAEQDYFKTVEHSDTVPNTKRFPVFFDGKIPHFALGQLIDGKVKIVFDSWNPSAEARGLKITNYRAFK
jgi:hypothetical protein